MPPHNHHQEPVVNLSERRRVVAPAYVAIAILAAAVGWGMAYRGLIGADADHEERLKKVEVQVDALPAIQKSVGEVQRDISWLVKLEEQRERREGRLTAKP